MKVLTYNLWHGLSPSSIFKFNLLEPLSRRENRQRQQLEALKNSDADVVFLQEANPTSHWRRQLSSLKTYQLFVQPDNVGVKWGGYGLPLNLNSSLILMLSRNWTTRFQMAEKLSGDFWSFHDSQLSIQLNESRYAQFVIADHNDYGKGMFVNTHLHHSSAYSPIWDEFLEELSGKYSLKPDHIRELRVFLKSGDGRRREELGQLLTRIDQLVKEWNCDFIVVGGDFNSVPESYVHQRMLSAGFIDSWLQCHSESSGYTWNPEENIDNYELVRNMKIPKPPLELFNDEIVLEQYRNTVKDQSLVPRRIDYIFVQNLLGPLNIEKAELFECPGTEIQYGSDHFGVVVQLKAQEN